MTAITIDETGHLQIPLAIRQQLGITVAQSLNVEIVNGCIILQPTSQEPTLHREGTALVLETPPLGNVDNLINDVREERIHNQMQP